MLPSLVNKEDATQHSVRQEVASNTEIWFIFTIFLFILAILYPEKMLYKQVVSEKSNYELTGVYLENMLRLDPKNTTLMAAAARVSLEQGNLDLAERLMNILEKRASKKVIKELMLMRFKLLRLQISRSDDTKYIAQKRKVLVSLIDNVAHKKLFDRKDALIWYKNARELSLNKASVLFWEALADANTSQELEQCVYGMQGDLYRRNRIKCAEKLVQKGGDSQKKWLKALWTLYSEENNYLKAAEVLEKLVKIDPAYREILAQTQSAAGKVEESSKLYMFLYRNSGSYEKKKSYLLKAIRALMEGKMYANAVKLAQRYEDNYLDDADMSQQLVELYLSMNALDAAHRLTLKMLKKEK